MAVNTPCKYFGNDHITRKSKLLLGIKRSGNKSKITDKVNETVKKKQDEGSIFTHEWLSVGCILYFYILECGAIKDWIK